MAQKLTTIRRADAVKNDRGRARNEDLGLRRGQFQRPRHNPLRRRRGPVWTRTTKAAWSDQHRVQHAEEKHQATDDLLLMTQSMHVGRATSPGQGSRVNGWSAHVAAHLWRCDDAPQVSRKASIERSMLAVPVMPRRCGRLGRGCGLRRGQGVDRNQGRRWGWGRRRGQGVDRNRWRGGRAWNPRVAETRQQVGIGVPCHYPSTCGAARPSQGCKVAKVRRQCIRIVRSVVADDAGASCGTRGSAVYKDLRAAHAADPDGMVKGRPLYAPRHGAGAFPRPMSPHLPSLNIALDICRAMNIKLGDMHRDQRRNFVGTTREQRSECVIRPGMAAGVQCHES